MNNYYDLDSEEMFGMVEPTEEELREIEEEEQFREDSKIWVER